MRHPLTIALITGSLLLTGCQNQGGVPAERSVPVVSVATPAPSPQVVAEAELEKPPSPPRLKGRAQPAETEPEPEKQSPEPPTEKKFPSNPTLELGGDYPKASVRKAQSGPKLAYHQPTPVFHPPSQAVRRPVPRHQAPAPPISSRRPQLPTRPLPAQRIPNLPSAYQPPTAPKPQPQLSIQQPSYPQSGNYRQWEKKHRALKQEYLQARADALNIKYNRGKPRFNANSSQVIMSSMAPPLPRTRPRAPWDKLGQAFDRSEQKRQALQNFERSRYGPPRPQIPQIPRPTVYRP